MDLRDGKMLIKLLEVLSGEKLVKTTPVMLLVMYILQCFSSGL